MTDHPDLTELVDAVRDHIETNVLPVIRADPRLYFQTLVALNLLKIGQREFTHSGDMQHAEWHGINELTGNNPDKPDCDDIAEELAARRTTLCEAIRRGEYDSPVAAARLAIYLGQSTSLQLTLNNPGLAARMAQETADNTYAL